LTRRDIEEWLEERELIDGCIRVLSESMGADDAEEYFWFNVADSHVGPRTPLFIQTL
jgi:hypothetical protein